MNSIFKYLYIKHLFGNIDTLNHFIIGNGPDNSPHFNNMIACYHQRKELSQKNYNEITSHSMSVLSNHLKRVPSEITNAQKLINNKNGHGHISNKCCSDLIKICNLSLDLINKYLI